MTSVTAVNRAEKREGHRGKGRQTVWTWQVRVRPRDAMSWKLCCGFQRRTEMVWPI